MQCKHSTRTARQASWLRRYDNFTQKYCRQYQVLFVSTVQKYNPAFFRYIYWIVTFVKLKWIMRPRNHGGELILPTSTFGGLSTI